MPILSPWPTSPPVEPPVSYRGAALQPVYHVSPMWPPPPALLCALFPYVRMLYEHLRTRVTRGFVHVQVPARRQPGQVPRQRRQQQQQRRQVARQELPRRGDHQEQLQRLRRPQEQRDQQQQRERQQRPQQQEQPNVNDFGTAAAQALSIRRVMDSSLGRLICGALVIPTIARTMGAILLHLSHVVPFVRIVIASRPPSPPPSPPPPPSPDAAVGVLGGLLGLWDCTRDCARTAFGLQVSDGDSARNIDIGVVTGGDGSGGSGATILSGLLTTSKEWATSDPVWYGVFLWGFFLRYFSLTGEPLTNL